MIGHDGVRATGRHETGTTTGALAASGTAAGRVEEAEQERATPDRRLTALTAARATRVAPIEAIAPRRAVRPRIAHPATGLPTRALVVTARTACRPVARMLARHAAGPTRPNVD
jgi:hypothetical protein